MTLTLLSQPHFFWGGQDGHKPPVAEQPPLLIEEVTIDEEDYQVVVTLINTSQLSVNAFMLDVTAWYSEKEVETWGFGQDMAGVVQTSPESSYSPDRMSLDRISLGETEVVRTNLRGGHAGLPIHVEVVLRSAVFQSATGYGSTDFLEDVLASRKARLQETSYWIKELKKLAKAPTAADLERLDLRLRVLRGPAASRVKSKTARNSAYGVVREVRDVIARLRSAGSRKSPDAIRLVLDYYVKLLEERKESFELSLPSEHRKTLAR